MTPERQRIEIARACWFKQPDASLSLWVEGVDPFNYIPDYLNDLNAMHAAEAGLLGHQMIRYQAVLSEICPKNPHVSCWDIIHATAAQRAEAFLRTLGKWEDDSR